MKKFFLLICLLVFACFSAQVFGQEITSSLEINGEKKTETTSVPPEGLGFGVKSEKVEVFKKYKYFPSPEVEKFQLPGVETLTERKKKSPTRLIIAGALTGAAGIAAGTLFTIYKIKDGDVSVNQFSPQGKEVFYPQGTQHVKYRDWGNGLLIAGGVFATWAIIETIIFASD